MPLLNLRTTHLCIFSPQRVSAKFASFHAQSHPQLNNSEALWFIKVLCTLCIRTTTTTTTTTTTNNLDVFGCDYLKNHLDTYLAFEVIRHVSFSFKNPTLAFRFFSFSRTNLEMLHPFVTYDLLLRLFCETGLLDLAKLVLDSMWVDGYLLDDDLFGLLVMSFANVGKFEVAMELFVSQELLFLRVGGGDEVGRRTSSFVYNDFLSLLVRVKRVDEAVRFFRDRILGSKCYLPDTCTFNIVLRGMCGVGELEKAFVLFNDMSSFGCSPDVISRNTLINGFSRNGYVDKADELLKKIRSQEGLSPDAVTYTSVISGYCKVGEMEKAFNLFGQMLSNGIKPNLITFNVLIDGFGKFGDMDAALNMYKRMLKFGYNPDVVTLTSLVDGHCRLGQVDKGLEIWTEMKARNLLPNVYTFSVIINSLCKQNRLYEARDFLKQLKCRGDIVPRAFIYNPVIDGFCKAGNVEEANVIVKEMEEKKCKPDKLTFTILILGHCMKGKMLEAISIFNKMLIVGCAPDSVTIKSLISCLRKAGMPNEAYKIKQAASEYLDTTITPSRRSLPNTGIPVAASK